MKINLICITQEIEICLKIIYLYKINLKLIQNNLIFFNKEIKLYISVKYYKMLLKIKFFKI